MTLRDFYAEVASKADTQGTKINAAETNRVLACMFDVLEDKSPAEAFELINKGLAQAARRRR